MQEVAEQMVSVVHTALKNFEMLQTSLIGQVEIDMVINVVIYIGLEYIYMSQYMNVLYDTLHVFI